MISRYLNDDAFDFRRVDADGNLLPDLREVASEDESIYPRVLPLMTESIE